MVRTTKPHRHILVFLAFLISVFVFVFVFPTYADLMAAAIMLRNPLRMGASTLACFGVVLAPLLIGSALTRRRPERWQKSRLATATWLILTLAFVFNLFCWYSLLASQRLANDAQQDTSGPKTSARQTILKADIRRPRWASGRVVPISYKVY